MNFKNTNMKRIVTLLAIAIISICCFAQSSSSKPPKYSENPSAKFQLYPTQNMWNFIKLNTQTGEMWQVQYSINDKNNRLGLVMNDRDLVGIGDEHVNGRFTLYPTENMYTFILLDTIDGRCWQVQWSTKAENRGIIARIYDL